MSSNSSAAENADWLEDFALFMALKDAHNGAAVDPVGDAAAQPANRRIG